MSEINYLSKSANVSFSGVALLIKDISVIILLPNDFALPDMYHFFWKCSLLLISRIQDLSFLDTTTTIETFTPHVPTYIPSLLFLPHWHLFHSLSLPPHLWMLLPLILRSLWQLWLPRVISLFLTEIHHMNVILLTVLCPTNTTYSPEFPSFVFALYSLQESKPYSEAVKSPV